MLHWLAVGAASAGTPTVRSSAMIPSADSSAPTESSTNAPDACPVVSSAATAGDATATVATKLSAAAPRAMRIRPISCLSVAHRNAPSGEGVGNVMGAADPGHPAAVGDHG